MLCDGWFQSLELGRDVCSCVKGDDTVYVSSLSGRAVGKLWVRVHAGAWLIGPGTPATLPPGDDPTRLRSIVTSNKRLLDQLIVVSKLLKSGGAS